MLLENYHNDIKYMTLNMIFNVVLMSNEQKFIYEMHIISRLVLYVG